MSQNLTPAAVVIGVLRDKFMVSLSSLMFLWNIKYVKQCSPSFKKCTNTLVKANSSSSFLYNMLKDMFSTKIKKIRIKFSIGPILFNSGQTKLLEVDTQQSV